LGSGDVAKALARGFVATGHAVKLGTRDPKSGKLDAFAQELGRSASLGTFSEAAEFGEVVVLAVLGSAALEAIRLAGPARFHGKVVIDTTNPLLFHGENAPPELFVGTTDSLGEQVQRALPEAHVVKAFNVVGNAHFYQPKFPGGPPDMFICGNDAAAKRTVAGLLHAFGWPALDIGGIDGARSLEPLCLLWVRTAFALGNFNIAFHLLRR
jgi:hypothetical protein